MQDNRRTGPPRSPQNSPRRPPGNEPVVFPSPVPCPLCAGAMQVFQRPASNALVCANTECDYWASAPSGWRFPNVFKMDPCKRGHIGAWVYKSAGRVVTWMCAAAVTTASPTIRCQLVVKEGEPQGFLNHDRTCARPYETRDGVISALYSAGPNGEQIPDLLLRAPGLTEGRMTSSLTKMLGNKWPFVRRSNEREPRIKAGSAYRYWLSWRGLAYAYLRWPELRKNNDIWKT